MGIASKDLLEHVRTHPEPRHPQVICPICISMPRAAQNKFVTDLTEHLRTAHNTAVRHMLFRDPTSRNALETLRSMSNRSEGTQEKIARLEESLTDFQTSMISGDLGRATVQLRRIKRDMGVNSQNSIDEMLSKLRLFDSHSETSEFTEAEPISRAELTEQAKQIEKEKTEKINETKKFLMHRKIPRILGPKEYAEKVKLTKDAGNFVATLLLSTMQNSESKADNDEEALEN